MCEEATGKEYYVNVTQKTVGVVSEEADYCHSDNVLGPFTSEDSAIEYAKQVYSNIHLNFSIEPVSA